MELVEIDVLRSKLNGKIVPKRWSFDHLIDWLFYLPLISVLPIVSGNFLFTQLKKSDNPNLGIIYLVFALVITGFLTYSIFNLNRLKPVNGISPQQNRQFIKNSIYNLNWKIKQDEVSLTIALVPWNWLSTHWGQQIVIIYDQEKILINCTTLLLYDIRSPFHWFTNRRLERILSKEFDVRVKETTR